MARDNDADAFSWDGDDRAVAVPDETFDATDEAPALARGWKAVGKGSQSVGEVEDDGTVVPASERGPAQVSNTLLVTVGVVGGVYLLYMIGWLIGGMRLRPFAHLIVSDAMYLPWLVLAVAAPLLWFVTALVLTKGRATWIRIVSLFAGVVLFIPWPFVMMGVIGS